MRNLPTVLGVLVIALWLPCWMLVLSLTGCESSSPGILKPLTPQAEATVSNTVAGVMQVAPVVVPPPWSAAVEAGGAAVLALLAAWQGLTHSRVKKLGGVPRVSREDDSQ